MDHSSYSDDEKLQQADAPSPAPEELLRKKMKLLIIMLSLVLIILLLPLASNHGLPLLKPMGISMLQRLWDAMRFIAMTAAISVGIISTSSQRNDKGSDRSARPRSHRSSAAPIASSSRESMISPNMINSFDANYRSGSPNLSVDRDVDDILYQTRSGGRMGNSQDSKGKEVIDEFSAAPSPSDAFPYASREAEMYGVERSSSNQVHSQQAPAQEENYENLMQTPIRESWRRNFSAGDAWFLAARIDEDKEEEDINFASTPRLSPGKSLEGSTQRKSTPIIDDKGPMSSKEIKSAVDRGFMNVYSGMIDDNYAELRMRKATTSRLADETRDSNGKGHRRSSSVDRRRPIHYDDQGPDRPGFKRILMDLSKERAVADGKLSNPSSTDKKSLNVREQSDWRPHSTHASISSSQNVRSTSSREQLTKASIQHHPSIGISAPNSSRIVKHSDSGSVVGSNQVVGHKQQEAVQMDAHQISQKQDDNELSREIKTDHDRTATQITQEQDDAVKEGNQRMQATTRSNQNVRRRRDDHQDAAQNKQKQDDHRAKGSYNQTLQEQADAKAAFAETLRKADTTMGRTDTSILQKQLPNDATNMYSRSSSRRKILLQSSKHSRSELNLEQLEQRGNTSSSVHALRPPPSSSSSNTNAKRKSFSYDFGDGFNPEWLMELEPPPPPGFNDDLENVMTSPNTKAGVSTPKPGSSKESSATFVQSLVPWRSSVPLNLSPSDLRAASPPETFIRGAPDRTSPGEVNRRADEFISNFHSALLRQRQESMERRRATKREL